MSYAISVSKESFHYKLCVFLSRNERFPLNNTHPHPYPRLVSRGASLRALARVSCRTSVSLAATALVLCNRARFSFGATTKAAVEPIEAKQPLTITTTTTTDHIFILRSNMINCHKLLMSLVIECEPYSLFLLPPLILASSSFSWGPNRRGEF